MSCVWFYLQITVKVGMGGQMGSQADLGGQEAAVDQDTEDAGQQWG